MNTNRISLTTTLFDTVFQGKTGVLGSYLIKGEKSVLIDPGPPVQAAQIIQELEHLGEKIDYLAITHIHLDHAAGTWDILQEYPETKVIVHPRGAQHLIDPNNLLEAALKQFKSEMPPYGEVFGVPPDSIIQSEDGMNIDLGGVQLQVFWTPGHSTHSQSFFEKENRLLFVGDAAGQIRRSYVLPASPPPFNPEQSIESVNRMMGLKASMVCISHFGYREDALEFLQEFKDRVMLWEKLSFECLDDDGTMVSYFELVISNDQEIENLTQSYPEEKSNVYSSLAGFLSYAKWKRQT